MSEATTSTPLPIELNNFCNNPGSRKKKVRAARGAGSGLGKTAGRGDKGPKSRSGKGKPRGFEGGQTPLHRRLPKFGFKSPFRVVFQIVNITSLEGKFEDGNSVDPAALVEKGLVQYSDQPIKILGEGSLTKKLTVKAHKFSKSANQKINQAGGSIEEIKIGSG